MIQKLWENLASKNIVGRYATYKESVDCVANNNYTSLSKKKRKEIEAFKSEVKKNDIYVESGDGFMFECPREWLQYAFSSEDDNLLKPDCDGDICDW